MQLSRFTDYSFRVLFYAGINHQRLVTLTEIAGYYNISAEHLRKVVHKLSKSGFIKTYRGNKGGLKLLLAPNAIRLGAVVEMGEGTSPLIDCGQVGCRISAFCSLRGVLHEAQQAFIGTMNKYTLEDLLENPILEQQLLNVPIAYPAPDPD